MASLATLREKTRRLIDERDSNNTHFDDDELDDNLNDATLFLGTEMEWAIQTSVATAVTDQALYSLPSDFISLTELYFDGKPLKILERDDLKEVNQNWQDANSGTPLYAYKSDNAVVGLYPAPDSSHSGDDIQIQYVSIPATLSDDTDIPDLHAAFQLCLPFYAASICERGMGNKKAADDLFAQYSTHKNALKSKVQRFSDDLYRFRWPGRV